jgi:hypothetical protein
MSAANSAAGTKTYLDGLRERAPSLQEDRSEAVAAAVVVARRQYDRHRVSHVCQSQKCVDLDW